MKIVIVAFTDGKKNSISYRDFSSVEKAVAFFKRMLKKSNVNTISTRKVE